MLWNIILAASFQLKLAETVFTLKKSPMQSSHQKIIAGNHYSQIFSVPCRIHFFRMQPRPLRDRTCIRDQCRGHFLQRSLQHANHFFGDSCITMHRSFQKCYKMLWTFISIIADHSLVVLSMASRSIAGFHRAPRPFLPLIVLALRGICTTS